MKSERTSAHLLISRKMKEISSYSRTFDSSYLRSKSEQGLDSLNAIHWHAQVNRDQVGILRKVNRLPLNPRDHSLTSLAQIISGFPVSLGGLKNGATFTLIFSRIVD